MNAFGASVVLLLSARNARPHLPQDARFACKRDVPCNEGRREPVERQRPSGEHTAYGACCRG
jgi:hypothetical protein